MYQRFGKGHEIPDEPELPACGHHVLAWFFELSNRRTPAFSGVAPITFQDISAWRDLTGTPVLPAEIRMILAMDNAFRSQAAEIHRSKSEKPNGPPPKGFFGK
jgi:hypothetical protein